jgi:hypothetical protein
MDLIKTMSAVEGITTFDSDAMANHRKRQSNTD